MRDSKADAALMRQRIRACEDACDALIKASEDCADACLDLNGDEENTTCFLAALDCVEISLAAARVLSWTTSTHHTSAIAILDACLRCCAVSTAACERMAVLHAPWITCTAACQRLSTACSNLLRLMQQTQSQPTN
ncbi:hypothetical protein C3B59_16365 [Cryobacterium zongtaii]|uniref:Four-helix bundle copper-binding protein n=1 Tax=Cryobacterium zongtaii TaxID=1259217 RepID=A0A2S3Z689_9MICO|nr:hypothetical protein C3B59_16365 [Cryobacterium zongtaii]